ncbi:MAG: aminoglycoside phosphotransferase family protein [Actinobacteria bacterium]|nr:aminoglycoside phosphotransferase family protein [Actinomycetota bacterium]
MASERDHYVLVPDAARSALLVNGTELPQARGRPGAAGVLEALRRAYDLEAPYLRPSRLLRGENGRPVGGLHELDAPPPKWEPPAGTAWISVDDAQPEALAPPELAVAVERWLSEQRGAPLPEERPPWARPGWLADASRWIKERVAALGLRSSGQVEMVEQWPLSSVLRLDTDGGRVYLKAVFSIFRREPALTQLLAERHPTLVPEVLAVDPHLGWMLMRELRGSLLGELAHESWSGALVAAARIHQVWAGRERELFAVGAHDRTLATLEAEIGAAFDAAGLPGARIVSELERRCTELTHGPLPQTLVHGDLHPGNVMVDGADSRIFDWSDACVSHPLFDLATFLPRCDDVTARETMLDAYLDTWSDYGSPGELRASYELAQPLAYVHHAISYRRITEALELDDRWWFAEEQTRGLSAATELLGRP